MALREYRRKRNFERTPEPRGGTAKSTSKSGLSFVIQKHAARRLHYDFRLELDGVLKSWAVPKGPSLDPADKSLAVHVEDHPLEYGSFEGVIPQGEYGGGTVMLWDRGTWEPLDDPTTGLRKGKLSFVLHGEKLHGRWALVRMRGGRSEDDRNWLLIKADDEHAQAGGAAASRKDDDRSVSTGRTMARIAKQADRVWSSSGEQPQNGKPAADKGRPRTVKASRQKRTAAKSARKPSRRGKAGTGGTSVDVEPSVLPRAKRAPMPEDLPPQLATLVKQAPRGDRWLHEMKFDGYRILCHLQNGRPRLITRRGQNWTDRFATIAEAAEQLPVDSAILDGEVVVLAPDGTTDFQALQNSLKTGRQTNFVYFVFDLPYLNGYDLTQTPLEDRKRQLQQLLEAAGEDAAPRLQYSDHIRGQGETVIQHACRQAMEGIVSKRADSRYESGRAGSWVKLKCLNRQEFVIGGYTNPSGGRKHFGALLLGYHDEAGRLVYCGRVGTGFTEQSLKQVMQELRTRKAEKPAFHKPLRGRDARGVHWVRPELVAEVEFAAWTDDGILRHPSFQGLREDKRPEDITRERPAVVPRSAAQKVVPQSPDRGTPPTAGLPPEQRQSRSSKRTTPQTASPPNRRRKQPAMPTTARRTKRTAPDGPVAGVTLSNPDRVLYPEQGLTKLDLARYYVAIADWVLPHMVDRPLTLVRCPRGRSNKCFYQKHLNESLPAGVHAVPIREKSGEADYLAISDLAGLISLVQLGVLEFHLWGSRIDQIERPDRLVFDLDPGEGVDWAGVVSAAFSLRERLTDLGLESFPRTTGGKGLHVVVPIDRRTDWDDAKQFTHDLADAMVRDEPARYIATLSKAKRRGKVFVDYLRNGRGATAIASYSTRSRPGATVATPLSWDELSPKTTPDQFTVETIPRRLASLKRDPWEAISKVRQSITNNMRQVVRG